MNNTCLAGTSAPGQEILVCKLHARAVPSLFIHFGQKGRKNTHTKKNPTVASLSPDSVQHWFAWRPVSPLLLNVETKTMTEDELWEVGPVGFLCEYRGLYSDRVNSVKSEQDTSHVEQVPTFSSWRF